jgi:5-methylcytosine-specific restriction protein A
VPIVRPCLEPPCPAVTFKGPRCPAHAREYQRRRDQQRGTPSQRGYNAEYLRNRKVVLAIVHSCHWCGRIATTVDHVLPLARGGSNDLDNLVPSCKPCNYRRGGLMRRGA